MTAVAFQRILFPTDLTPASLPAYGHAFRLALQAHSRLDVVHVHLPEHPPAWSVMPSPRELLVQWGRLRSHDDLHAYQRLGVRVTMRAFPSFELEQPLRELLADAPPDLLVVGTHARKGLERLRVPSIAEDLARASMSPTLFVPFDARPFVDLGTGSVSLRHVLLPVASQEDLDATLPAAIALVEAFQAAHVTFHVLHVGGRSELPATPLLDDPRYEIAFDVRHGPVDAEIVAAIQADDADLCVMATRGHNTLGDMLRGSHTEIVVRNGACPVLAIPLPG